MPVSPPVRLREVRDINDPSLDTGLDIYSAAFPVSEQFEPGAWLSFLRYLLAPPPDRFGRSRHFLTVETGEETVGMVYGEIHTLASRRVGYLVYFAITDERRGAGLGTEAYRLLRNWFLRHQNCDLFLFEAETEESGPLALRRLRWYLRNGARLLSGVDYSLRLPNRPAVALRILFETDNPAIDPDTIYRAANQVLAFAAGRDEATMPDPVHASGTPGIVDLSGFP